MALPTTITGIQLPAHGGFSGPFVSSAGNVYILGINTTTTSQLRMMKATDPTSSFSAVDDANAPNTGNALINSLWGYQDGDTLHIGTWAPSSTTAEVRYHTFLMDSDAWSVKNEDVANISATPNALGRNVCIPGLRSGQPVIIYGGDTDTI